MRPLYNFLHKLNSNLCLDKKQILKKGDRYYFLEKNIRPLTTGDFFYAGTYLGKIKGETFFPSFPLLAMMTKQEANKTKVDAKTEWLFVCGRDVFKRGITEITGSKRKGTYTLILNQNGECLGFGKIIRGPEEEQGRNQPTIRNITDIGDFLRREKRSQLHQ